MKEFSIGNSNMSKFCCHYFNLKSKSVLICRVELLCIQMFSFLLFSVTCKVLVYFGSVLYCKYYPSVYINDFTKLKSYWLLFFLVPKSFSTEGGGRRHAAWREQHLLVPHPTCLTNVNKHFPLYFAGVAMGL